MFSSFTRSFRAGRRPITSPSSAWSPSTDITPVAWIDASDSENYTTSGTTLTGVKIGRAHV